MMVCMMVLWVEMVLALALFLSMGKNPEEGGEVGLSYAFISHTMQLVIMIVMGVISIPVLAKERGRLLSK